MDTRPFSPAQRKFITTLLTDRELDFNTAPPETLERCLDFMGEKFISITEGSALITWLKTQPFKKAEVKVTTQATTLEPGVYVLPDGTIVKLQENKAKTNAYANRWVITSGAHLNENDEHVKGAWEYAPELKKQLKPEMRMTLEEAKAFMLKFGQCAKCARKLKAAQSVEDGIGPVCKKYFAVAA